MSLRGRLEVHEHDLAGRPPAGGAESLPGLPRGAEEMAPQARLVDASVGRRSYRRPEPAPTAADAPFRAAPRATFVSMYDELAQRKADLVAARPAIESPVSWDKVLRRSIPSGTMAPVPGDPCSPGQKLRGHEAAHVVQQSHGGAPVDGLVRGMRNEDAAIVREDDAWRSRAARGVAGVRVGAGESAGAASTQLLALSEGGGARSSQDLARREPRRRGGPVYRLLQYTGYHIKLHPVAPGLAGKPWDTLHVTFELFPEDPRCPKVYFDEYGARLVAHDSDRVNADYRLYYAGRAGRPTFAELIERAQSHVNGFLRDDAPPLVARDLALAAPCAAQPEISVVARPPAAPAILCALDAEPRSPLAAIGTPIARPHARVPALWRVCVSAFLVGIVVAATIMLGLWELGML